MQLFIQNLDTGGILLLVFFILVAIARPFTTFFHELGHAIPALLLTGQKVTVYLGSYGDPKGSFRFQIGLLEIWMKRNVITWNSGLCISSAKNITPFKKFVYIISGPVFSFLITFFSFYAILVFDLHGALKLLFVLILLYAVFDLFINLIPDKNPIALHDGTFTYNDGQQLLTLFRQRNLDKEIGKGADLFNKGEYYQAGLVFEKLLKKAVIPEFYRNAISAYYYAKDYARANRIHSEFHAHLELTAHDYGMAGIVKSRLRRYAESLHDYNKAIELDPENAMALNNSGFTHIQLGQYKEAIDFFNKALLLNLEDAYAFSNKGLANIKCGRIGQGLSDIHYALKLDENNAYAYRNLGLYYLDQENYPAALENFYRSKSLSDDIVDLDILISQAAGKATERFNS